MSVPLPDASSSSIDAEAEESTFSPKNYTDEVVSDTVISSIKEPIQVIYCPKCTWPPEFWLVKFI